MQIKLFTEVIGYLFDAQVWLEGQEIRLSYDGDKTWKSTDVIDVTDGKLEVIFHGVGAPGTEWKLTIKQIEPSEKELYKKEGEIRPTGHSLVMNSIDLA